MVPAGDWEPLDDGQAEWLRPQAITTDSMLVELVQVPLELLPTTQQLLRWPTGPTMHDFADGHAEAVYLGASLTPAKMLTATENPATKQRLGLHLDNWDRLPYRQRLHSRRRLCLNLGPGSRYLLLAGVDALAACRSVHADFERRCPHTDDVRQFAARRHGLRCYRLRLEPGEGYLAPTELLPHDGSTEGQSESSLAAFWLGRWPAGSLPSLV